MGKNKSKSAFPSPPHIPRTPYVPEGVGAEGSADGRGASSVAAQSIVMRRGVGDDTAVKDTSPLLGPASSPRTVLGTATLSRLSSGFAVDARIRTNEILTWIHTFPDSSPPPVDSIPEITPSILEIYGIITLILLMAILAGGAAAPFASYVVEFLEKLFDTPSLLDIAIVCAGVIPPIIFTAGASTDFFFILSTPHLRPSFILSLAIAFFAAPATGLTAAKQLPSLARFSIANAILTNTAVMSRNLFFPLQSKLFIDGFKIHPDKELLLTIIRKFKSLLTTKKKDISDEALFHSNVEKLLALLYSVQQQKDTPDFFKFCIMISYIINEFIVLYDLKLSIKDDFIKNLAAKHNGILSTPLAIALVLAILSSLTNISTALKAEDFSAEVYWGLKLPNWFIAFNNFIPQVIQQTAFISLLLTGQTSCECDSVPRTILLAIPFGIYVFSRALIAYTYPVIPNEVVSIAQAGLNGLAATALSSFSLNRQVRAGTDFMQMRRYRDTIEAKFTHPDSPSDDMETTPEDSNQESAEIVLLRKFAENLEAMVLKMSPTTAKLAISTINQILQQQANADLEECRSSPRRSHSGHFSLGAGAAAAGAIAATCTPQGSYGAMGAAAAGAAAAASSTPSRRSYSAREAADGSGISGGSGESQPKSRAMVTPEKSKKNGRSMQAASAITTIVNMEKGTARDIPGVMLELAETTPDRADHSPGVRVGHLSSNKDVIPELEEDDDDVHAIAATPSSPLRRRARTATTEGPASPANSTLIEILRKGAQEQLHLARAQRQGRTRSWCETVMAFFCCARNYDYGILNEESAPVSAAAPRH